MSPASTKRMRPVITMVAARPMSEVGFRAVQARSPVVNWSTTDSPDSIPHQADHTDEAMRSRPVPPMKPRSTRQPLATEGVETPQGQDAPLGNVSLKKPIILPSKPTPVKPVKPQRLPPEEAAISMPPRVPSRTCVPTDQCEEENIVNELLERTSPVSHTAVPSVRRPTIILPVRSSKARPTSSDHSSAKAVSGQHQPDASAGSHATTQKTRPTIIGYPRHQPHHQGESSNGSKNTSLARSFNNDSNNYISEKTPGFQKREPLATNRLITEAHTHNAVGVEKRVVSTPTRSLNRNQSKQETLQTAPLTALVRPTPLAKAKPNVAPKPQVKPKPALARVNPSGGEETRQMSPTLTASSIEKATAPVVEKATKQTFNVFQKHTEKSVQQAIMAKVITPHLGSSQFVQKKTAPLVEKATKQMYTSAEKQAEASVQKAIVDTVVGHQPGSSETMHGRKVAQSGSNQALPARFINQEVTASSVEKATAPHVEKATKQTFDVIQKRTEKSVQQAIMAKVITPHLGSSKFVQKRTTPLVEKATKQMYASAEKQAEASVQKAIVDTVVGHQPGSSETMHGRKVAQSGSNQALPTQFMNQKVTASSVEKATAPHVEKATKQTFNVVQKHTEKSVQQAIMAKVITPHLGSSKFVQKRTTPLVEKATNQMYASAEKRAEESVQKAIVDTVVGPQSGPSESEPTSRASHSGTSQALPHKMCAMAKSTLNKSSMSSAVTNGSGEHSGRSMTNLTSSGVESGRAAEMPEAPPARRKSFAGNIKSKLSKARPKSMNFDVLGTKHKDDGRTQPRVAAHDDSMLVKKKNPPPRPSIGPLRPAVKSVSHTARSHMNEVRQSMSGHGLSILPPKYAHQAQTPHADVPHGIALFDYEASQPDELSFQAGDTVTLLRKVDEQWFHGKAGVKEGIFPSSFIDVLVPISSEGKTHHMCDATNSSKDMTYASYSQPTSDYCPSNECYLPGKQEEDDCSGVKAVALYDFVGEPGELSFLTGAAICVHGKLTPDWLYGELYCERGRFPASFVSVSMEKLLQLDQESIDGVTGQSTNDHSKEQTEIVSGWKEENRSIPNSGMMQYKECETPFELLQETAYCIALHPFSGENTDDLTFEAGDRITLLAYVDSDWLKGSLNGQEGIFPKAFVDIIEAGSSSDVTDSGASDTIYSNITTAAPPVTTKEETTHSTYAIDSYTEFSGSMARALFDFTGDTEDDLCFKSGEEIEVLEWISNEWMKGRIAGRTGIFPSNFVEIIEI